LVCRVYSNIPYGFLRAHPPLPAAGERLASNFLNTIEEQDQVRGIAGSCSPTKKVREVVYAVVRAGGRQEKVEVGTIVTMDRVKAGKDGAIELAAVLLVDGDKITSDAKALAKVKVTAEVLEDLRGPKIVIQKFKNKTGYKKRQGHRQELTRVKITGIK
jgi:large subunit ribosomal protein L21